MHPSLQSLLIEEDEFRSLSGLPKHWTMRSLFELAEQRISLQQQPRWIRWRQQAQTWGRKMLGMFCLVAFCTLLLMGFLALAGLLRRPSWLFWIVGALGLSAWLTSQPDPQLQNLDSMRHLMVLAREVTSLNRLVRAIDVRDQLEQVGSVASRLQDREQVIQSLHRIREDLIKALKTERILRDNEDIVALSPELFEDTLSNLQGRRVAQQGGDYARLLDQSLDIGLTVQSELKRLESEFRRP